LYFGIIWLGNCFGYFLQNIGQFFPNHLVTLMENEPYFCLGVSSVTPAFGQQISGRPMPPTFRTLQSQLFLICGHCYKTFFGLVFYFRLRKESLTT
jgi:hypothetical protein